LVADKKEEGGIEGKSERGKERQRERVTCPEIGLQN